MWFKGGDIMFDLFVLDTCPYCQKVMDFLKDNNINFHKLDTSNNDNAIRLLSLGGKDQVPFLFNSDTKEGLYESDEIIKYFENYQKG
jgi:glutaredoxin 2